MKCMLSNISFSTNENERKIGGYINVTNRESEILFSRRRGKHFKEVMESGTFQDSINDGRNIPLLLEHDYGKQLADTGSGTLSLREDQIGLRFDAVINDEEVYRKIQNGEINSCSFGFNVLSEKVEPINGNLEKRYIKKIRLNEVSLVSNPAYKGSLCETRALETEEVVVDKEIAEEVVENTKTEAVEEVVEEVVENKEEPKEEETTEEVVEQEERNSIDKAMLKELIKEVLMEMNSVEERSEESTEKEEVVEEKEEVNTEETKTEEVVEEEKTTEEKREIDPRILKMRVDLLKFI